MDNDNDNENSNDNDNDNDNYNYNHNYNLGLIYRHPISPSHRPTVPNLPSETHLAFVMYQFQSRPSLQSRPSPRHQLPCCDDESLIYRSCDNSFRCRRYEKYTLKKK